VAVKHQSSSSSRKLYVFSTDYKIPYKQLEMRPIFFIGLGPITRFSWV